MLQFHLLLPEKYADFVVVVVRICQHFSWKGKKRVQGIKILGVWRSKTSSRATNTVLLV